MAVDALILALTAAALHAGWNLVLGGAADSESATAVAFLAGTVAFAPAAVLAGGAGADALPFMAASAVLEVAYLALLARAYARADVAVVYPVARGAAPVLVLLASAPFPGHAVRPLQGAGVVVIAGGVLVLRGLPRSADGRTVGRGLAIAACIAGYTIVDAHGIAHASAAPYLEVVTGVPALAYAAAIAARRGPGVLLAALSPKVALAGGAAFVAYGLVLLALERAPAASVAAVRETGVVMAAILAGPLLGRRVTPLRVLTCAAVSAGVAAVALG